MSGRLTYLAQTAVPQAIERAGLVRSLFRGDVYDRWNNAAVVRYPAVDFEQVNVEKVSDDLKRYTLRFYVADRLYDDGTGYNGNPIGLPLQPAVDVNGMVQWQLLKSVAYDSNTKAYSDSVRPMSNDNYNADFYQPMLPIAIPLPTDLAAGVEFTFPIADYLPPVVTNFGMTIDFLSSFIAFRNERNQYPHLALLVATSTGVNTYDTVWFGRYSYSPILYPFLPLFTDDGIHYRVPEYTDGSNQRLMLNYCRGRKFFGYVVIQHNYGLTAFYPDLSTAFQPIPANLPWGMQPTKEVDTYLFDTCEAAIDTLVAELRKDSSILEADYSTLSPFSQKFADNLAGYYTDIAITVPNAINIC